MRKKGGAVWKTAPVAAGYFFFFAAFFFAAFFAFFAIVPPKGPDSAGWRPLTSLLPVA
jgi:hypothetical protein